MTNQIYAFSSYQPGVKTQTSDFYEGTEAEDFIDHYREGNYASHLHIYGDKKKALLHYYQLNEMWNEIEVLNADD